MVLSKQLLSPCHVIDAAVQWDRRGRARRFAYLSCVDSGTGAAGLCKLDLVRRSTRWNSLPFAQTARGVALLDSVGSEQDGRWLAAVVHDHANDKSGILLAPLKSWTPRSSAVIRIPRGVRLGDALAWSTRPPHGPGEPMRAQRRVSKGLSKPCAPVPSC